MARKESVTTRLNRLSAAMRVFRGHSNNAYINCGDCWLWALLAHRMLPGSKMYTIGGSMHVCLEYNGKYYDSESPRGVKTWKNLKCCKRCGLGSYRGVEVEEADAQYIIEAKESGDFSMYAEDVEIEAIYEIAQVA